MMRMLLLVSMLGWCLTAQAERDEPINKLPARFDSLGPTVQHLVLDSGRQVHYVDDGEEGWHPVVLTGGLGTSVRIIRLLDFLRSMRQELKIRVITVERNGFGQTAFDPDLTMTDFSKEVESVLAHLGIQKFSVFGISGGGPYTSKIASRNADRLLSVHLAATAPSLGQPDRCQEGSPASVYRDMLRQPMMFFGFPADSPMHGVDGFQDSAYDEAARAHNLRGQMADPAPLDHEISLYCKEGAIDTAQVEVPVYVYQGLADAVLDASSDKAWQDAYPGTEVIFRNYVGEGHDVQYRHLDQILLDIAGFGDRLLVCENGENKLLESDEKIGPNALLGLCAWR